MSEISQLPPLTPPEHDERYVKLARVSSASDYAQVMTVLTEEVFVMTGGKIARETCHKALLNNVSEDEVLLARVEYLARHYSPEDAGVIADFLSNELGQKILAMNSTLMRVSMAMADHLSQSRGDKIVSELRQGASRIIMPGM